MVTNSSPISSARPSFQAGNVSRQGPLRVGIVSDFLEEKWPSMDLVSDMLTRQLQELDPAAIAATRLRPAMRWRFARIPGIGSRSSLRNADRFLNRFCDYPRWLRQRAKDFDLFHLIDHSYSQLVHVLPSERTVITCHDLDTFRCLLEPAQEKRPRWFRAMAQRVLDGFLQAAHVICNSCATRDQLLRYRLFPPEKITVIHYGVHPAFTPRPNAEVVAEACRLLGPKPPEEIRLLSVGSTIPRKRMDILLRVFAAVHRQLPQARLIRVGGAFTETQSQLARDLGVEGLVSVLPFVNSSILSAIYGQAELLLQPSEAEGFGMPVTEALACGCPVLASDIASLREAGGTACSYRPVGDVEAWSAAAVSILEANADPNALEDWRRQAYEGAARFSWEENARRTAEIYGKVMNR
jgi:glycosyltransferase involved in cell wall biosynthesis